MGATMTRRDVREAPRAPAYWPSSKVTTRHQERLAVVYVRQSTVQQTIRHQESTRLQYGLVERALSLGWSRERVLVIDDDLGRSGATAVGRPGFQRLVAEVGLDHVGLILGVEMSRLARSCRDWHQLLEVCAVFGTLICDLDGIYDPAQYNDRLLLGLKGTMSEAELHILKQRMQQGRVAKARRGELAFRLPMGYVRRPSGEIVMDPDERVQIVIRTIFDQFEQRATVHGVLCYLVEHGIDLPVRCKFGPNIGELEWRRPNRSTLSNVLHNAFYAGAYVYGKRRVDPRRKRSRHSGRAVVSFGEWEVLLKDRLPAYISWEQYEHNVTQLAANDSRAMGGVRRGPALLAGLLKCGRCGGRMHVVYSGRRLRYACRSGSNRYAQPECDSLAGRVLDEKMAHLVLRALEPAALEVSLAVAADVEAERHRVEAHWLKRLERAHYEAERARRQYDAVEPENRLVARTLERAFEEKLSALQMLQQEHDRYTVERPTILSAEERDSIRALASDIPALWNASTTTTADRQTIIRQLVEQIVVKLDGNTERVQLEIRWVGGHRSTTSVIRPVARFDQLSYFSALVDRISALRAEHLSSREIARHLNEEGWRPPKQTTFRADMVRSLLARQRIMDPNRRPKKGSQRLRQHEWRLPDLAAKLQMPPISLYVWLRRGWVSGRQLEDEPHRPWVIRADAQELSRLRALRLAPKCGWRSPLKQIARA
jgi:DNA invertase Pin-like site-specific DNA recombinase